MIYSMPINIRTSMVNEYDHFTLHGYEDLFMQVVEGYFFEITSDQMKKDHVAWVLLSLAIEVQQYIHRGERLVAKIFDTEQMGFIYRKDIGFYRNDELVITAVAFMAMMDLDARKLYRGDYRKYCSEFSVHEKLMEANSRIAVELTSENPHMHEVKIMPSCIDALGHCNNERYFAMIYNSLDEEHQTMYGFHRLEMTFVRECRKFNRLKVYRENQGDMCLVKGIKEDGTVTFMSKLYYDKTPE